MAAQIISGPRRKRLEAAVTLIQWFSVGAFVSSTITYYLDAFVAVSLPGHMVELVGGAVAASILAAFKSV
jgi:hypothetical protein